MPLSAGGVSAGGGAGVGSGVGVVSGVGAGGVEVASGVGSGAGVGGVEVASGDIDSVGFSDVIAAPGPSPTAPPRVRGFDRDGNPVSGLDLIAYGTTGYGANVGAGRIDVQPRVLTGPGPSPAYGPHVRAFQYAPGGGDRKSTRLNSSHAELSRMPSSA